MDTMNPPENTATPEKTPAKAPVNLPFFIFIGPPHHGKTEARKIFCELTGLRGGSTSDVIYALLATEWKTTSDELKAKPKEEIRPKLIEFGDYLCGNIGRPKLVDGNEGGLGDDRQVYRCPSALVRVLFHLGCQVVDGVRRRLELRETIDRLTWLGVPAITVWIERPGHPTVKDNTELTADDADVTLVNDGDLEAFRQKIREWIEKGCAPQGVSYSIDVRASISRHIIFQRPDSSGLGRNLGWHGEQPRAQPSDAEAEASGHL